ncbi:class I SAM-dependent methyltransferase [Cytobacillus solani]|uniref:Class I SAM-dependent methyltransferase n=1 Tax=Cytobacillus solani TaxID=1637975 RepID=A0A0Q3SID7_9BACI|nr:class I SAM-dependent methyltransferase [Cytobacillus solani]KOP82306.1 hypothetical protein AMS60_07270 [Bacillus sp. FJAT-21945]KQL19316.1 hypothetical protein AN957_12540 [Cytobacillus solani]
MDWIYYKPLFEYDNYHISIKDNSAWSGHRNFAYDLVRFMKPKKIVELGTHYGASFFSFCQALKDEGLSSKCFAIDTWQGDEHSGLYGEDVFLTVKDIVDLYYSSIAELVRTTFDEAVSRFEDQSINILHIDGYHTFEAVSHDYQTWLPKLSDNGVILFHDISFYDNEFGVYKLWNMLKEDYPAFEFKHAFGLGVLFPKGNSKKFNEIIQRATELQKRYEKLSKYTGLS